MTARPRPPAGVGVGVGGGRGDADSPSSHIPVAQGLTVSPVVPHEREEIVGKGPADLEPEHPVARIQDPAGRSRGSLTPGCVRGYSCLPSGGEERALGLASVAPAAPAQVGPPQASPSCPSGPGLPRLQGLGLRL